ncbi:centrosomal protein POC5 [Perognathus longimembris pacificus]|uniref:centrosomal protein POC5 n=1 Tax=Perognathus longimembris pacificus TaxID=214514 RepID=UPI002019F4C2|nr:centrosomal protein POC5 [Perognathus longimembris pacificus]XP_048224244.1 centrosomal protein POC5 [Perognathus longimembris pacificus]
MSSDEDRYSLPAVQNDSDHGSSVSTGLQEEYEELLRYAVVTPNVESIASQLPHPRAEVAPDLRLPTTMDMLHNQVRETGADVGKGYDFHISSRSRTSGSPPLLSPRKPHPVMDFFSSHLLDDSSSPDTNSTQTETHQVFVGDRLVSDENLHKMENVLDLWSSGLKTNIISELSKWRLNFIDWHRMEMKKEREKHAAHINQLSSQIIELKELQKAFEVSIGRKDEVISSLSQALGKQKEKIELMRTFFHWRISHVKSRQDVYEGKLADQYFQRTLLKKVWKGWRSVVQRQWKEVVERACQARAEEVCVQISNDYENKIAMLSGALENSKTEIQRLQQEKEHFEDSMKKAFMRGVCALNLEAMTMFQNKNDSGLDFTSSRREEGGPGVPGRERPGHAEGPPASASVLPSAAASVTSAGAASASSGPGPGPASVLSAGSGAPAAQEDMYVPRVVTSAQQKASKTITARITGRSDFAPKNRVSSSLAIMGVSPPMSSVVVEKHHPVTVQTISQAAAAKYPRTIHPEGAAASRSLGSRSAHTQSLANVPSIKVVD